MDEVNGKFLEDRMFLLGTFRIPGFGSVLVGGCSWLGGKAIVWATKDGEHLSATKGALGRGWDMETCWHPEHPHSKGFAKLTGFCTSELGRALLSSPAAQQGWGSTTPTNLSVILAASHCSYLKIHSCNHFFPPEGADPIRQRPNRCVAITPRAARWDVTLQPWQMSLGLAPREGRAPRFGGSQPRIPPQSRDAALAGRAPQAPVTWSVALSRHRKGAGLGSPERMLDPGHWVRAAAFSDKVWKMQICSSPVLMNSDCLDFALNNGRNYQR